MGVTNKMKRRNDNKIIVLISLAIVMLFVLTPVLNAKNSNYSRSLEKSQLYIPVILKNNAIDLLIIAPDDFYSALEPLEKHKNDMSVKTKLVTLSEVYEQGYWGRDKPEKIKYYIKEAYDNWEIKYVLLVGGMIGQSREWYLPIRRIELNCDWEESIISDLYFADIYDSEGNFSTWDSDNDNNYAEWNEGEQPEDEFISLIPEVAIGRLPCRNKMEVKIMVKKIIDYETNTKGKEWFNEMVVFAGDTYPEYKNPLWVGYEGEYYGDLAIDYMSDFNPTRKYTSDETLTHWKDIVKEFSKGYGIVYFVGHGCPLSWSNHLPNSSKRIESFTIYHIPLIRNKEKQPVCVLSGCHNLQFDVNIFNIFDAEKRYHAEYAPESMGWWLTRKINGGSIATLGATALGYTKEDKVAFNGGINEIEVEFFKQYGENGYDILGEAWQQAVIWYLETYQIPWGTTLTNDSWVDMQVPSTWILFGDPSLKIGGY